MQLTIQEEIIDTRVVYDKIAGPGVAIDHDASNHEDMLEKLLGEEYKKTYKSDKNIPKV